MYVYIYIYIYIIKNEDIFKKYIGVFPSNFISHFIKFHTIMKENNNFQYSFFIMNTDKGDKNRTHWCVAHIIMSDFRIE